MAEIKKIELQILLRAYQSGDLSHTATGVAKEMVKMGFGLVKGKRWVWERRDRERIREFLVGACGVEDPDTFHVNFKTLTRIGTAAHIPEEKYAGIRPRSDFVLLRGLHGKVRLNGEENILRSPRSHLHEHIDGIKSVEHDCVVAVENFEAFDNFESLDIRAFPFADPLIVYRGDPVNFPSTARRLLFNAALPVVAFTDFDPQGLNIASAMPNCVGAIFPADLDGLNRRDLFAKQRILLGDPEKYPVPWHDIIETMVAARHCMTQEHMFAHDVPFIFLPVKGDTVIL